MVVLRLKPMGRTHRPFYRLCAMEKRAPVTGKSLEQLGWYDPVAPEGKQFKLDLDRIKHWLGVGAQPSETVIGLIRRAGGAEILGDRFARPAAKPAKKK